MEPMIEIGERPRSKESLEVVVQWSSGGSYTLGKVWLEPGDVVEFFSEELCLLLEEIANEIRRMSNGHS